MKPRAAALVVALAFLCAAAVFGPSDAERAAEEVADRAAAEQIRAEAERTEAVRFAELLATPPSPPPVGPQGYVVRLGCIPQRFDPYAVCRGECIGVPAFVRHGGPLAYLDAAPPGFPDSGNLIQCQHPAPEGLVKFQIIIDQVPSHLVCPSRLVAHANLCLAEAGGR